MKKVLTALLVALLIFCLTACGTRSENIAWELGIGPEISEGEEVSYFDDHGGFHGDGTTCIAYSFDGDTALEVIKNSSDWSEFPLDDTVRIIVYGITDENGSRGPYLCDGEGNTLVPEIQNGYYRLIDRQEDKEKDILDRYSLNFTLGLYDTDTDTLYLCEMDT